MLDGGTAPFRLPGAGAPRWGDAVPPPPRPGDPLVSGAAGSAADLFGTKPSRSVRLLRNGYERLSAPVAILLLLVSARVNPAYGLSRWARWRLGWRIYRNTKHLPSLTSYRAHLVMAAKLLELPPKVEGVVVECGCYLGGATANLSLVCDLVDRDLIVYDSFEGLPPAEENDQYANAAGEGFLRADIEAVQDNVRRFGIIERCTFRKGWFQETLPAHTEPVAMCFLDVDYQASLHVCMVELWPRLSPKGYVFIDEYVYLDYCALFFSERWWRTYLDTDPPGLMGAGTGVPAGNFYLGPFLANPKHAPASVAYTQKGSSGLWRYDPPA